MPAIVHRLIKLEQQLFRAVAHVLPKASRDASVSAAIEQAGVCSSWDELAEKMQAGSALPDHDGRTECEIRQSAATHAAARTIFEESLG